MTTMREALDPKTVERLASDLAAHDGMNFAAMEDDQRAAYNGKPYWRRLAEAAIRSLNSQTSAEKA